MAWPLLQWCYYRCICSSSHSSSGGKDCPGTQNQGSETCFPSCLWCPSTLWSWSKLNYLPHSLLILNTVSFRFSMLYSSLWLRPSLLKWSITQGSCPAHFQSLSTTRPVNSQPKELGSMNLLGVNRLMGSSNSSSTNYDKRATTRLLQVQRKLSRGLTVQFIPKRSLTSQVTSLPMNLPWLLISHLTKKMVMSLLIRYAHIPFYFHFSFTFSTSPIHHYAPPLWCDRTTIALASSDWSRLFDGHMTYDSHVFTSILSVSNVPPPAVWPITSSRTPRSGTLYNFALCSLSCFPFIFNLPVFAFR